MEVLNINQANRKYPEISSKIKQLSVKAYKNANDDDFNLNIDTEIRISEIFNEDIQEHIDEMTRISELLKTENKSKRHLNQLWNFTYIPNNSASVSKNERKIPICGFKSNINSVYNNLTYPDNLINEVNLTHKNIIVKRLMDKSLKKTTIQEDTLENNIDDNKNVNLELNEQVKENTKEIQHNMDFYNNVMISEDLNFIVLNKNKLGESCIQTIHHEDNAFLNSKRKKDVEDKSIKLSKDCDNINNKVKLNRKKEVSDIGFFKTIKAFEFCYFK